MSVKYEEKKLEPPARRLAQDTKVAREEKQGLVYFHLPGHPS
jgi:hypothetical protein